jgi:hypothetical protein
LIEEQLAIDVDAAGRIEFLPGGVVASIAVPLSAGVVSGWQEEPIALPVKEV